jgi:hypothetical protein
MTHAHAIFSKAIELVIESAALVFITLSLARLVAEDIKRLRAIVKRDRANDD